MWAIDLKKLSVRSCFDILLQGGMIAKSLFLEPDFPAHAVHLVVTLATPHTPVVLTDPLLGDYYDRVAKSPDWAAASNVTVVSLGGGVKDLVVRAGLTLSDQADVSVLVSGIQLQPLKKSF